MAPNLIDTFYRLQRLSGWYHRFYLDEYFYIRIYGLFTVSVKFLQESTYGLSLAISLYVLDCILIIIQGKTVLLFKNSISAQRCNYFV